MRKETTLNLSKRIFVSAETNAFSLYFFVRSKITCLFIVSIVMFLCAGCEDMYKELDRIQNETIHVDSDKIEGKNDGKLIHITGKVTHDSNLADSLFHIEVSDGLFLERCVEMYQWEEIQDTIDGKQTFSYEKVWASTCKDSSNFAKSGHDNPKRIPISEEKFFPKNLKIGSFQIADFSVCETDVYKVKRTSAIPERYNGMYVFVKDGVIFLTQQKTKEFSIGDLKISYSYFPKEKTMSIIGMQKGGTIIVKYIRRGNKSVRQIIDSERNSLNFAIVFGILILVIIVGGIVKTV